MTATPNLLDRLADVEVPPLPEGLPEHVHRRVNGLLLIGHLADLAVRGLPFAVAAFAQAFGAMVTYSLSGRYAIGRAAGDRPRER